MCCVEIFKVSKLPTNHPFLHHQRLSQPSCPKLAPNLPPELRPAGRGEAERGGEGEGVGCCVRLLCGLPFAPGRVCGIERDFGYETGSSLSEGYFSRATSNCVFREGDDNSCPRVSRLVAQPTTFAASHFTPKSTLWPTRFALKSRHK